MSVYGSNPSLGRSRSLRIPASAPLKAPPTSTTTITSTSYVSSFLSNLRLLDLDLRDDWPGITALTFSIKDVQQNQKKRIQCVEWALYHLFAIWDPEETRNKLQPFFPPLEQLQSLNLRAALFRCLDNAKKTGVLGRDIVLRKTMLDECKGERLEEALAAFSNMVLKKVIAENQEHHDTSIARQIAFENLSYHGDRDVLVALNLAHRVSLSNGLLDKNEKRKKILDLEQLLGLEDKRLIRRQEQLKEVKGRQRVLEQVASRDVDAIRHNVRSNWVGNEHWLEESLYGVDKAKDGGLLSSPFDKAWKHVHIGNIDHLEARNHKGLVDQLDARVQDQQSRLARWQAFGRQLEKNGSVSPSKKKISESKASTGYELGFNQHENLHVGRGESAMSNAVAVPKLEDYSRLIDSMRNELAAIGRPTKKQHFSLESVELARSPESAILQTIQTTEQVSALAADDDEEGWSSASQTEVDDVNIFSSISQSASLASASEEISRESTILQRDTMSTITPTLSHSAMHQENSMSQLNGSPPQRTLSPLPFEQFLESSSQSKLTPSTSHEAELADEILNSIAAASPSPKKRHTLSLAERTRLSISRNTHSKFSDLHDEYEVPDLSRLTIRSRPSLAVRTPSDENEFGKHADLIERTRKSMAGFEAAQKKAQLERRKSVKDEKRKQRQSSYFPRVGEEPPVDESKLEMMESDPDYDSVFMSRPKIATSPMMSPERIVEEEEGSSLV